MNKPNLDEAERAMERKADKRNRKKQTKMKLSGSKVKQLQRIIIKKIKH